MGTFSQSQHWAVPGLIALCHHLSFPGKESKLFVILTLQLRKLRHKETEAEVHRGKKNWVSGSCAPRGAIVCLAVGTLGFLMVPGDN